MKPEIPMRDTAADILASETETKRVLEEVAEYINTLTQGWPEDIKRLQVNLLVEALELYVYGDRDKGIKPIRSRAKRNTMERVLDIKMLNNALIRDKMKGYIRGQRERLIDNSNS